MPSGKTLFLLALAVLAGACTAPALAPSDHIVMFDGDGDPVHASTSLLGLVRPMREMGRRDYRAHVEEMLAALRADAPRAEDGRRRVLIFIHGGLNTQVRTTRRARALRDPILRDGSWPIFVNWQSSLPSSYADHLFFVRQGEDWGWWGLPFFPVYLARDLAAGIGEIPVVLVSQATAFLRGLPGFLVGEQRAMGRVLDRIGLPEPVEPFEDVPPGLEPGPFPEDREPVPIDIHVGADGKRWPGLMADLLMGLATSPLKIAQEPFLGGTGTSAWNMLQRRIYLLFHTEEEFRAGLTGPGPRGFPYFLRRLRELQEAEGLELTLIAHSMGASIANEILRTEPELELDNLVYMAAACSLRDYEDAVFPYMRRHASTRMFHLTLHPKGEVREKQFLDLTSRGSLLVWIDGFLAQPLTPLDRVAGNLNNLILAIHRTPDELRDRIHVRAFPTGRGTDPAYPTKHAHFTERRFWDPAFWEPPHAGQPPLTLR